MTLRPDDALPEAGAHRALVVVAAGSGTRLGYGIPKAAVELAGRSILSHSLDPVDRSLKFDQIVLVAPDDDRVISELAEIGQVISNRSGAALSAVVGGSTRSASVAAGVQEISEFAQARSWDPSDVSVLIHDAARPLAPTQVFHRVLDQLAQGSQAVVPAVPVTDTVKEVRPLDNDGAAVVVSTPARSSLRAVQTPQGFSLELLHQLADHTSTLADAEAEALTDEAMFAEQQGIDVTVVPGDERALKITTPIDLLTAKALYEQQNAGAEPTAGAESNAHAALNAEAEPLESPSGADFSSGAAETPAVIVPRVGIGHDVHAVADDSTPRPMWLAGLQWPGVQGLSGHSDGDAVAHACCDALFSAAGIGDLGVHFGSDTTGDARDDVAGASGVSLLREAVRRVNQAGFSVSSISVQFIGRRPKFGPRREEAQRILSEAVGAPVAVSATTSDGLGFTGRGEGIMATATAVLIPAS